MSGQAMTVLRVLRERPQGITSLEALNELRIMRLASRVDELRQGGYDIRTEMIRVPSGKRVACYTLRGAGRPPVLPAPAPRVAAPTLFGEAFGVVRRKGAHW